MIRQTIIVFLIFLFSLCLKLDAQNIQNYFQTDGLSSNYVECVAVDIFDNIWFGTSNGVSMFDGTSWITFNQSQYPNLLSNNIKSIAAASNGDIWVGTDFGACKLSSGVIGGSWQSYTTSDGLANNKIVRIDEGLNGDMWFSHSSFSAGISVFDGTNWNSYNSPNLPASGVCATAFDSNGDQWFASPLNGLVHYDGTSFTNITTSSGLLSDYSTSICIDNSNNIWLGSQDGMTVVENNLNQFTFHTIMYSLPPPDTLNPVVEITKDSWGRVWAAIYVGYLAEGGVAYWNGSQWNDYDINDGLAGSNIKGIAIDSQDNVWVATTTGVSKIIPITSSSNEIEKLYQFYHNPSERKINIVGKHETISIYDNLGRRYRFEKSNNGIYNLSNLTFGIYYVNILSNNQSYTYSIVIE